MKVGITFSTFDLFHAGHVKMLEEDRPEKNGPSHSIIERYIKHKGFKHVDEIVPYV